MKNGQSDKKRFRFALFVGMLSASLFSSSGAFASVVLNQDNFYSQISEDIATNLNRNYVLESDIDISRVVRTDDGSGGIVESAPTGATVFGTFIGSIDGANKKISGLASPLFDAIGGDGEANISNLVLVTSNDGLQGNGALANNIYLGTTIENVKASGVVNGTTDNVGGLVGSTASDVTVRDSMFSGEVVGTGSAVGGLVGNSGGSIEGSSFRGKVTAGSGEHIGGLAGYIQGDVSRSYSITTIFTDNAKYVGGLVGRTEGRIFDSYAHVNGNIEAHHTAGGLAGVSLGVITDSYANVLGNISVGKSWGGSSTAGGIVGVAYGAISNAHATISGSILASGDYAGGIAGQANDSITNSYALINGVITGENYIGGIAGESAGIQNSYTQISGDIFGLSYVGGLTGKNHNGINNSSAIVLGSIAGQDFTGGLVGDARSSVSGSYSSIAGNVSGNNYTGGLAGKVDSHDVVNSFLSVGGSISGSSNTGGFIGQTDGDILNSIGYIGGGITGSDYVGGLTGQAGAGVILNTDIKVVGSVTGDDYVGGLSGYFANNFEGPHIDNSDIEIRGVLLGNSDVGQLIGRFFGGNIVSSYVSLGGMIGGTSDSDLFGYIYPHNSRTTSYTDTEKVWDISNLPAFPSFLQTINQGLTPTKFATNVCLNQGMPYLIQRSTSYANSCTSGSNSRKNRFRTSVEARKVTKIESPIGFKNEISPSKALSFSFLSLREKIDLVKIKFVEISPKDNVKVTKKAGEALQISLKSEGKEPAELWVASPDGSWLLAGMITFDKDGKAILPPLQFKNAGDYTLVLNKPTEGSSKGSEPLNQTGSLLVEVI